MNNIFFSQTKLTRLLLQISSYFQLKFKKILKKKNHKKKENGYYLVDFQTQITFPLFFYESRKSFCLRKDLLGSV